MTDDAAKILGWMQKAVALEHTIPEVERGAGLERERVVVALAHLATTKAVQVLGSKPRTTKFRLAQLPNDRES
jgi:hypothetical protein